MFIAGSCFDVDVNVLSFHKPKWRLLLQVITRLSNGPFPRRVLCTGMGGGGAYATLCAVWAAVTFPLAQIRHITFGAPAVRFNAWHGHLLSAYAYLFINS